MDLNTFATNFGIPATISLYLVYWLTQRHDKALSSVKDAITNQTKVLNHTLTKMIKQQDNNKKEYIKELQIISKNNVYQIKKELKNANKCH